jgi:N-methylhydantoinase A
LSSYRVGVDIGGTFTDFTVANVETGEIIVEKCLTTSARPDEGVMTGLSLCEQRWPDAVRNADSVIHATTLLTNVVLERKAGAIGLLATKGFRDVLEFGRETRYDVYDPFIEFPVPMAPRNLRVGISERMLVDGTVQVPLNEDDVRQAARLFRQAQVRAVAVCFLHSYLYGEHERRAREILLEELPGVEVSISSEVHPEPKEYERTSTTVVDAYVKPTAARYLDHLVSQLAAKGYNNGLFMMLSNGGTASADTVKRFPVQAVESGPAAGVEAAMHYGRLIGEGRLLSFDMGGTTAKLCLVEDGKAARTQSFEVDRVQRFKPGSGVPIAIPVYDLLEIGAGGGSIARLNSLSLLQVGPDSASSRPGPACYGLGGEDPTVTDADLALGYLAPESFLGGSMKLDLDAAKRALSEKIAVKSGITESEAAWGVHNLVNETMASAARVYVAEKGQAPRDLSLVAFGGAGPVHAVGLARKLGCPRVIIPPLPGVMSSFGLLAAPVAVERSRSIRRRLIDCDVNILQDVTKQLEGESQDLLPSGLKTSFRYSVDVMRVGQDYPIEVEFNGNWIGPGAIGDLQDSFDQVYARLYGRVDDETPLQLVTVRVAALHEVEAPSIALPTIASEASSRHRPIYSPVSGKFVSAVVVQRSDLSPGTRIPGPAIIEERESTTIIDVGDVLRVDAVGCLIVDLAIASV